jgi:hypothetical protein
MIYRKVKKDPAGFEYMDTALEAITDHEEQREMFQTTAAQSYLAKVHHIEAVQRGAHSAGTIE